MSKEVNGFISWLRGWFDDIYALKGSGGSVTLNDVYPVGSIYMSVNSTSPSTLFGGTWQQLEDTFLFATSGTADTGYQATDGSADAVVVKHNHTQNQHTHNAFEGHYFVETNATSLGVGTNKRLASTNSNGSWYVYSSTSSSPTYYRHTTTANTTATNQESGVDGTGKNMPPYMKVYMWKRTD